MELEPLVKDFENFLTTTEVARMAAEQDRDYVDHKQWTDKEIATLEGRNQAPVVINRVKVKVNLLTGLQKTQRTDPRALPRTPEHQDASDAATEALRFVADNTDFPNTSSDGFEDLVVWGYEACITEVEEKGREFEIGVNQILADRFYFDPHSRRKDFKDAKYMGIVLWMDEDEAKATFPGNDENIESALGGADNVDGSTFEDKPSWVDRKRKRIRICQHYFKEKGVWHVAYFTSLFFLIEPKPSNYLDEFGEPDNPIEAQAAYIDRDNNRYGEVRSYIWIQDEINHRRSKALHDLSVRQTMGEKGAVDINKVKQELAKANGHVEVTPGMKFEILDTTDRAQGNLALYQEAKGEIDSIGANAALSGEPDSDLSGKAIQRLQQGGMAELRSLYDGHAMWEKRVYRQMWNRIKQFWDAEKWIRVTDDENNLKWVGLNQPVTLGAKLQKAAQEGDERAMAALQQLLSTQDPRLNEVIETENNVAELDVDIILTQGPDVTTVHEEQFEALARLAQVYGPQEVPFDVLLELSNIPNKDRVKELLKPEEQDPQQVQAQQELLADQAEDARELADLELEEKRATIAKLKADTIKTSVDAQAQELENLAVESGLERLSAQTG